MTLGFKTKINDKPTYFVEKILAGLHGEKGFQGFKLSNLYSHDLDYLETAKPKLHTIRYDDKDRWKIGNKIHFVIGNRTKKRFQFAQVLKVKSIQKIQIKNVFNDRHSILIDDIILSKKQIETLALNDGFNSVDEFWDYFTGTDADAKIIHWTNLRY